eukprot:gene709-995_t
MAHSTRPEAPNLNRWLDLGREALLPMQPGPEVLRRTEQRAVVLQLERLMEYPMVRSRVQSGQISLHGWHYVIEDGEVHVFDVQTGGFVPASQSDHSGTGPYQPYVEHDGQPETQIIGPHETLTPAPTQPHLVP